MHELSIALEVCRIAEEQVDPEDLPNIVELGLDIGDDAGIESANLEFCLEALLASPPFGGAKPVIRTLPGDLLQLSYLEVEDGRPDD